MSVPDSENLYLYEYTLLKHFKCRNPVRNTTQIHLNNIVLNSEILSIVSLHIFKQRKIINM